LDKLIKYNNTLIWKSGCRRRSSSSIVVQCFLIQRAAATIPRCPCPETLLFLFSSPSSLQMKWLKDTGAPIASVSVSFKLWVPRMNTSKHFDSLSRITVKAGFRICHKIIFQSNWLQIKHFYTLKIMSKMISDYLTI